jgi:hypothetical protein
MNEYVIFPQYEITREGDYYSINSSIYLHLDLEDKVKVYSYPIESLYVAKTKAELELVIKAHLRECFRLAKYMILTPEMAVHLPLQEYLTKEDPNFLNKLHYYYP